METQITNVYGRPNIEKKHVVVYSVTGGTHKVSCLLPDLYTALDFAKYTSTSILQPLLLARLKSYKRSYHVS